MKVAIIEPFLKEYIGHYFSFVNELKAGFEALGDSVSVYLPFDAETSLEGKRYLPSPFENKEQKNYLIKVKKIFKDIFSYAKGFSKISKENDLVVISTANFYPIITALGVSNIVCPFFLYFHTMELAQSKISFLSKFIWNLYSKSISQIAIVAPFYLERGDIEAKITKKTVKFFFNAPYPFSVPIVNNQNREKELVNNFSLGFFGDARLDKNFPAVANFVLNNFSKYLFIIQCHPPATRKYEPGIIDWVNKIKTLPRERVTVFEETIEPKLYYEYLNRVSAVFCLYDPREFRQRVSGVLSEAWMAGKPVIVLNGSWLADQVQKYGGGVIINDLSQESIKKGVETIKENLKNFEQEAQEAGVMLLKNNNGKALAQFLKQKYSEFY